MDRRAFLKNTAILTGASLALRGVGMVFRVYLAARIGAQGMGLYQLITTVYNLFLTVATAGLGVASARLVTEELALGGGGRLRSLCRKLLAAALGLGLLAGTAQFFGADLAAGAWIRDSRAAPALRILAVGLPAAGVMSCLQGYFMARRAVALPTAAQMGEQLLRIALVLALLPGALELGLGEACAAVVLAGTAAELLSGGAVWLGWRRDLVRAEGGRTPVPAPGVGRRLWAIAAPVAASRYVGSALRTLENVLVPGCLALYTASRETALEQFGALRGMAMAVLFFPFSFLSTLSTLLMPEITEAYARGRSRSLERLISRTIAVTLGVAVPVGGFFTLFAYRLGELLFHDAQVGLYLRVLGPVMPFMYLESMVDGILRGIDQQLATFRYSVLDSAARILLVLLLVPWRGMQGFLFVMLLSNLFTGYMNLRRLLRATGLRPRWGRWAVRPLLAFLAGALAYGALRSPLAARGLLPDILLGGAVVGAVYLLGMALTGGVREMMMGEE